MLAGYSLMKGGNGIATVLSGNDTTTNWLDSIWLSGN
jgi:hypothetical protein